MAQIPDDSHDYNRLEPAPNKDTPPFGSGCFATGLAAAMGGACIAIAYSMASSHHAHGPVGIAMLLFLALGLVFIFAAGRNGIRHFGVANTIAILAISVWPGSCIGLGLFPEGHGNKAAIRASCQNNLKQLGLICFMYVNENPSGKAPQLSSEPGRLMFNNDAGGGTPVYPELLTDLEILYCPEAEERPDIDQLTHDIAMDDQAYFYLGYAITNQEQLEAFADAYRATIASGGDFADDLNARDMTLHRLQPGETSYGPAPEENVPPAEIPMLIERADSHLPGGGNILYADGHVEFVKMKSKWPMTQEAVDLLLSLDELPQLLD